MILLRGRLVAHGQSRFQGELVGREQCRSCGQEMPAQEASGVEE